MLLLVLSLLLTRMQRAVPPGSMKVKQRKEKEKTEELVAHETAYSWRPRPRGARPSSRGSTCGLDLLRHQPQPTHATHGHTSSY